MKKQIGILILGAVVILILLLILIFVPAPEDKPQVIENGEETETEFVEIGDGIVLELPKGLSADDIVLEEVPEDALIAPDLQREVNIPDVFPEDAKKVMATNIANAITAIEADPTSFGDWLTLGNLRGDIQDYEGALDVYEYLNAVVPENDIAHLNAATTYHLHIKDFPKAEENFQRAVTNNVTNILAYIGYHELYKFSYKQDTNRAVEVLEEGIERTNDPNLYLALGVYHMDQDNTLAAREALINGKEEAKDNPAAQALIPQFDVLLSEL